MRGELKVMASKRLDIYHSLSNSFEMIPKDNLILGDCKEALASFEDNSFDSLITDPPAGISFMGRNWDTFSSDLPPSDFMNWFAGFVDGEGCFSIHHKHKNDTYDCQFQIALRNDDKPILQQIKSILKIGTLRTQISKDGNDKAVFCVSSKKDCLRLVEILRAAPLRAKKALDFELWIEGLEEWITHKPNEWETMADARERLMASRVYTEYGKTAGSPESRAFITNMKLVFKECLRVLKPGAHGLVWAIPRTSHWTASALEYAGFEIRDVITHIFGSGFPKSHDVSKGIDKMMGCERERIIGTTGSNNTECRGNYNLGEAISGEAKQWSGFGTALKPASEHWILVRKPLSESTVAKNVLKYGTGALNIDASRIEGVPRTTHKDGNMLAKPDCIFNSSNPEDYLGIRRENPTGRFPANLILSHNEDCELVGVKEMKSGTTNSRTEKTTGLFNPGTHEKKINSWINENGKETVEAWQCTEGCAVKMLDEQSGERRSSGIYPAKEKKQSKAMFANAPQPELTNIYNDTGGASRFFYCAKASKRDRNEGLDGMPTKKSSCMNGDRGNPNGNSFTLTERANHHPTVKSTKLMEYLIRLITPPNGTVLDPFMGSGSTGVAAKRLGFSFTGIEKELEYFDIAKQRINYNYSRAK